MGTPASASAACTPASAQHERTASPLSFRQARKQGISVSAMLTVPPLGYRRGVLTHRNFEKEGGGQVEFGMLTLAAGDDS